MAGKNALKIVENEILDGLSRTHPAKQYASLKDNIVPDNHGDHWCLLVIAPTALKTKIFRARWGRGKREGGGALERGGARVRRIIGGYARSQLLAWKFSHGNFQAVPHHFFDRKTCGGIGFVLSLLVSDPSTTLTLLRWLQVHLKIFVSQRAG